MNILVTGANGFVGAALIPHLIEAGHHVTAMVRNKKQQKKKNDGVKLIVLIIWFMALKVRVASLNIRKL
jgi:uncharacterized protein YbjT (DUF2867 family)